MMWILIGLFSYIFFGSVADLQYPVATRDWNRINKTSCFTEFFQKFSWIKNRRILKAGAS